MTIARWNKRCVLQLVIWILIILSSSRVRPLSLSSPWTTFTSSGSSNCLLTKTTIFIFIFQLKEKRRLAYEGLKDRTRKGDTYTSEKRSRSWPPSQDNEVLAGRRWELPVAKNGSVAWPYNPPKREITESVKFIAGRAPVRTT